MHFRYSPKADVSSPPCPPPLSARTGLMHCNKKYLLDHIIGKGEQLRRHPVCGRQQLVGDGQVQHLHVW
jgi:hypothetical protein